MPPVPRLLAVAAALGAGLLGGCRDEPRSVFSRDGTVEFVLDEYRLDPAVVSVPAGAITFRARNAGILTHNVRVVRVRSPIAGTRTLRPGAAGRTTFELARGDYKLVCTIANHDVLGMRGRLRVR